MKPPFVLLSCFNAIMWEAITLIQFAVHFPTRWLSLGVFATLCFAVFANIIGMKVKA
jgi:hypothetical protein